MNAQSNPILKTDNPAVPRLHVSARALAAHLRRGGLIAYPTESCYGLGCDPRNRNAVLRILKLKQRLQDDSACLQVFLYDYAQKCRSRQR